MTEQRRWSTPTRSRDNVPLAAVAVALTAPAALAVVPHAPVLRGIGACLAAIAAVGLFDAVVRWPRVHTDWQGLVIRRRWRRTVRWTWRQVVGVGAGSAEGVVLVSSPEGWSAEVDDHGDEFRGLRGRLRLLVALARDQSVLVTAIAATGPSRAVRPDAEAIAAAIATEVARNGGRPAAELLAPDPEQDLIDDGPARGPVLEVLQTLAIVAFAVAVVWVLSVT